MSNANQWVEVSCTPDAGWLWLVPRIFMYWSSPPPSSLVLRSSGLLEMRGLEGVDGVAKSEGIDANAVG